jgi:hypothetical protein
LSKINVPTLHSSGLQLPIHIRKENKESTELLEVRIGEEGSKSSPTEFRFLLTKSFPDSDFFIIGRIFSSRELLELGGPCGYLEANCGEELLDIPGGIE